MDPQVNQTVRSLSIRSIYALLMLAFLAISNFWVIRTQVAESKALAARGERYSRQLELVSRASGIGRQMQKTASGRERSELASSLLPIAQLIEINHRTLIEGDPEADIPPVTSPHIRSLYFDAPSQLDRRVREYVAGLVRLARGPVDPATSGVDQLIEQVVSVGALQDALTANSNYYRNENSAKIFLVEQLNFWHFFSTMAVLAIVALLVFYPMIRRIRLVMGNLSTLNASLEQRIQDRTAALVARARELEHSNDALRELRAAMENAVEGIGRLSAEGLLIAANAALAEMFGRQVAELKDVPWKDVIAESEHSRFDAAMNHARHEAMQILEIRIASADEEVRYLEIVIVTAHDKRMNFDGFHLFAKNTTARKTAEDALRESEARFRQLTDHLQQVLWLSEPANGRMIYVSPAFDDVFGFSRERIYESAEVWEQSIHAEDRDRIREARLERQACGAYDEEYRIVRQDGEVRWIRDRAFPILIEDQYSGRVAGIAEDITQARHMQQQLLLSQRSFENLIMNCDVAMLVTDSEGRVHFVNPAAQQLLRKRSNELLGNVFSFAVMEQERNEMTVFEGAQQVGVAEINLIRTEWDGEVAHLLIFHDITSRKLAEAELHAYADELKRSNKELEDFAFVASHDLQEPLRKIKAFGDRLSKKYHTELGEEGQMYLDRMQNASMRMDALIRDLLTYSRVTTKGQPFKPVDLQAVVEEVLGDLEVRIEQSLGTVDVAPLPTIEADAMQMRQLFQNLIGNALKFRKKGVSPIVRVYAEPVSERLSTIHDTPGPMTQMCRIMVQDNGIGFDEKYLDRIFEVFQRLHGRDAYEGTGTGLAVCRKIATRHHGSITATSAPDMGTTFIVTLPIDQPEQEKRI